MGFRGDREKELGLGARERVTGHVLDRKRIRFRIANYAGDSCCCTGNKFGRVSCRQSSSLAGALLFPVAPSLPVHWCPMPRCRIPASWPAVYYAATHPQSGLDRLCIHSSLSFAFSSSAVISWPLRRVDVDVDPS
uniref:HDC07400 n=1 Tax=Drosophila melanogaster TaxID=7227 RepID=Q6IG29_DROME|nr:TPA_inf: HDC07400 [Drosophila melanogaster]